MGAGLPSWDEGLFENEGSQLVCIQLSCSVYCNPLLTSPLPRAERPRRQAGPEILRPALRLAELIRPERQVRTVRVVLCIIGS